MHDDGALIGERKADFTEIYTAPDPRAYYRTLRPLDYQIPQQALPVLESVITVADRIAGPRTVLDVCCSYGINAALLRHHVTLEELGARYTGTDVDDLPPDTLLDAERAFFASRCRRPNLSVVGLDTSTPAIDFAVNAGLLTDGWAEDLESSAPSPALVSGIRDVGVVISTGGVGYVGPPTFDRLLAALPQPEDLWLAVFVLRVFAYDEIAATLGQYGLVTEKMPGTFRQRRFADRNEYEAANHDVALRGLDPTGKEADGWYHAECFLTRPAAEAARLPAAALLAAALPDTNG